MIINVQHFDIRSTDALDNMVEERIFSLGSRLQIDRADVRLEHHGESSPPYHVRVHIATPGPDVIAESHGHTIRAAIDKVARELEDRISERSLRKKQKIKSNLNAPRAFKLS